MCSWRDADLTLAQVGWMDRQKDNFLRDQSGMRRQLSLLQSLIALMDPALHRHLVDTDASSLFMCFRWLLVAFKCVSRCAVLADAADANSRSMTRA